MKRLSNPIITFLLLAVGCSLIACDNFTEKKYVKVSDPTFPYDLWNETEMTTLPDPLSEVSGIHYLDDDLIACIEDEHGIIYIYDLMEKAIIKKIKFGKDGDYEDIEVIDSVAYVIRNDGKIYQVTNFLSENPKIEKFDTPLNAKNDVEGMCYDEENNRLLIACKNDAGIKKELPGQRAVYGFNLDKMKLGKKPIFTIFLTELSNKAKMQLDFAPSGIAIHPTTKEIYLISTIGKLMLILNSSGKFIKAKRLSINNKFNQPEGISFSKTGELFISNEARLSEANILRFSPSTFQEETK